VGLGCKLGLGEFPSLWEEILEGRSYIQQTKMREGEGKWKDFPKNRALCSSIYEAAELYTLFRQFKT